MVVDLLIKWSARDEKSHPGFVHIPCVRTGEGGPLGGGGAKPLPHLWALET